MKSRSFFEKSPIIVPFQYSKVSIKKEVKSHCSFHLLSADNSALLFSSLQRAKLLCPPPAEKAGAAKKAIPRGVAFCFFHCNVNWSMMLLMALYRWGFSSPMGTGSPYRMLV